MALITCPECGRRITDQEERCIGCGLSMEKIRKIQVKAILGEQDLKCVVCGTEFNLNDGCCPNCKQPALSLSGGEDVRKAAKKHKADAGKAKP